MDGFSRRILSIDVGYTLLTNCSNLVRAYCGMENDCVAVAQRFIRRDGGDDSSMYGKSVSNQRIEALKSILGNDCIRWWIDVFI